MKKRYTLLFLLSLFLACFTATAQNLVPNPSFEQYNHCPEGFGNIAFSPLYDSFPTVACWINPTRAGTPDYYNACAADSTLVSIPLNGPFGISYQTARTGNAYVGIYTYKHAATSYLCEYVECKLLHELKKKHWHMVSFYSSRANWSAYAVEKLGAKFTDTLLYIDSSANPLNDLNIALLPDVYSAPRKYINTDSTKWTRISGIYIAKGTEEWLTLGRFADTLPMTYFVGNPFGSAEGYSYIDDASVIDLNDADSYTPATVFSSHVCVSDFPASLAATAKGNIHEWSTGDTTATTTIMDTGTYWCMTATDSTYFMDTIRVNTIPPAPQAIDTEICQFAANPIITVAGSSITWYANSDTLGESIQPAINTTAPGIKTFYVSQTVNNCESNKTPINITIPTLPTTHLRDTAVCAGQSVSLGMSQFGINYLWNTGDTSCCITADTQGVYRLRQWNVCGTVTDSMTLQLLPCDSCIWTPSAFTPNNDGRNDYFKIIARCPLTYYQIEIVNRWGQAVFKSNDINHYWDGTCNGVPADVGTYSYFIRYIPYYPGAQVMLMKGNVTVIK